MVSELDRRLRFPFAIDRNAGRAVEERDYEAYVRQLIRQVLLTARGERVCRPEFGAGVRQLVFAPNGAGAASLAQTLIYEALTRWLDRVIRVEEVTVTAVESTMDITIRYRILQTGTSAILNEEVTF